MKQKKYFFLLLLCCNIFAKKPVGIENCGTSCYMNATIQCLYYVRLLVNFLVKERSNYKVGSPTQELITIFDLLDKSQGIISQDTIGGFYEKIIDPLIVQRTNLQPLQQQDAQELLNALLEHISNIDIQSNEFMIKSDFKKLVEFQENPTIRCKDNTGTVIHTEKLNPSLQQLLSLPSAGHTLIDCLNKHFEAEKLLPPNEVHWCKAPFIGYKTVTLSNLPEIIIIQFKLFDGSGNKVLTPISIPEIVDFSQYTEDKNNNYRYSLTSVAVHGGETIQSGHYWAYVKTDNMWYECNDSAITQKVPDFLGTHRWNPHQDITGRPYILFYQKSIGAEPITPIPSTHDLQQHLETLAHELGIVASLLT